HLDLRTPLDRRNRRDLWRRRRSQDFEGKRMNPRKTLDIAVLPGDGIGPETVDAALAVVTAALVKYDVAWAPRRLPIGFEALHAVGTTMPESSFERARDADGVILGPVSHNEYPSADEGGVNPSGT